ncbi:MAG: carboxypeptidase regulatory-like domain-containing protein [Calditrichaeota bacterium]|nr:carboxypeptidase regulatory-like domain-containing protein [Calditrichota bacterium]
MHPGRFCSGLCLAGGFVLMMAACRPRAPQLTAQVELTAPWVLDSLQAMPGVRVVAVEERRALVRLSERQFLRLSERGYELALVVPLSEAPHIPSWYPQRAQVESRLQALADSFPHLAARHQIGKASAGHPAIWALKISDNAASEEDEPAAIFYGGLHADEALGVMACVHLAEELCARYATDSSLRSLVDNAEIWVVPLLNPEGYELVLSRRIGFPWWRKNLRDNNGNGIFEPAHDGVDLNRNFGFNWEAGGSGDPSSWYYRGPHPFSEWETAAIESLSVARRFVVGIGFHSHGRKVLYPWSNAPEPPDAKLLKETANSLAKSLQASGAHYDVLPLNAQSGQSSVWLYGALGTLDFTIELGTEYFPEEPEAEKELRGAVQAAIDLLARLAGPGIRGQVVDAGTKAPLHAQVSVAGLDNDAIWPRMTDPRTGRFYRLLEPGLYQLLVRAKGHRPRRLQIRVHEGPAEDVVVELEAEDSARGSGGAP